MNKKFNKTNVNLAVMEDPERARHFCSLPAQNDNGKEKRKDLLRWAVRGAGHEPASCPVPSPFLMCQSWLK